jgi:GNAT superfamily N-acetyltransferase
MLRPTVPSDTPTLVAIAEHTKFFKPHELVALREVLDDYHKDQRAHRAYSYEKEGHIHGFVYFAPAEMTVQTWYIYWIFVEKSIQAKGIGSKLLKSAEEEATAAGGRLMLIETSGLPIYEPTRKFYVKHGYRLEATLHDFYEDGDDLTVFWKRLKPVESHA